MKFVIPLFTFLIGFNAFAMSPKEYLACGSKDAEALIKVKTGQEILKLEMNSVTGNYSNYLSAKESGNQKDVKNFESKIHKLKNCVEVEKLLANESSKLASKSLKASAFKGEYKNIAQQALVAEGFTRAANEISHKQIAIISTLVQGGGSGIYASLDIRNNKELSALFDQYYYYDSEGSLNVRTETDEADKDQLQIEYLEKERELLKTLSADEVERLVSLDMAERILANWIEKDIVKNPYLNE